MTPPPFEGPIPKAPPTDQRTGRLPDGPPKPPISPSSIDDFTEEPSLVVNPDAPRLLINTGHVNENQNSADIDRRTIINLAEHPVTINSLENHNHHTIIDARASHGRVYAESHIGFDAGHRKKENAMMH
ncbi:MAG: hypothetical protein V1898_03470 [Patescibacteria group bacterium]